MLYRLIFQKKEVDWTQGMISGDPKHHTFIFVDFSGLVSNAADKS